MKRTISILVALIASAGLATTAVAQGRHDDRPHGYDAKVAAAQTASPTQSRYVPIGPRAHDYPGRWIGPAASATKSTAAATAPKSDAGALAKSTEK